MSSDSLTTQTTEKIEQPLAPIAMGERGLKIRDWNELYRLAHAVMQGRMNPQSLKTHQAVATAMITGMELGLGPMASLRVISVVKGMPSAWGKGSYALAMTHPLYVRHEVSWQIGKEDETELPPEYVSLEEIPNNVRCICRTWRKGVEKPFTKSFSVAQAKMANLWAMVGGENDTKMPWSLYWDEMLYHKAVGNSMEMGLPEAFLGLINAPAQEMERIAAEQEIEPPMPPPDQPMTLTPSSSRKPPKEEVIDHVPSVEEIEKTADELGFDPVKFESLLKQYPNAVFFYRFGADYVSYRHHAEIVAKHFGDTVDMENGQSSYTIDEKDMQKSIESMTDKKLTVALINDPRMPPVIHSPLPDLEEAKPEKKESKKQKQKEVIDPQEPEAATPPEKAATVNQIMKEFRESRPEHAERSRMTQDEESRYVVCECKGKWKFKQVGTVMIFEDVHPGDGTCETPDRPADKQKASGKYELPPRPNLGATGIAFESELKSGSRTDILETMTLFERKLKNTKDATALAELHWLVELAIKCLVDVNNDSTTIQRASSWMSDVKGKFPQDRFEAIRQLLIERSKK